MILFYGEGRLGNQIFQYLALSRIAKTSELVLAAGLEELEGPLDLHGPRLKVLSRDKTIKRLIKYLVVPVLVRPIARTLRLINYAHEIRHQGVPNEGTGDLALQAGLLRRVTFVDGGYYQKPLDWTPIFPATLVSVKQELRDTARDFLRTVTSCEDRLAFVHVRRNDYLSFSSFGVTDLCLPLSYYRNAIKELRLRVGPCHLIFVTDDKGWVEDNFRDIDKKTIVSSDTITDFSIMAECTDGVLSNSTFSLTAALLLTNPGVVVGPKYWFGFRVSKWLPPSIEIRHERVIYVSVIEDHISA
jgi:hypothetical protein